MTKRCCEYSFVAHSAADRSTGELLACPRSRWQALLNRLDHAGWLGWPGLVWRWARGLNLLPKVARNSIASSSAGPSSVSGGGSGQPPCGADVAVTCW